MANTLSEERSQYKPSPIVRGAGRRASDVPLREEIVPTLRIESKATDSLVTSTYTPSPVDDTLNPKADAPA